MSPSYRIVHYNADPFTGLRLPLGAVVQGRDGQLQVARVARIPLLEAGDPVHTLAMQRALGRLEQIDRSDRLPSAFGPDVTLGAAAPIPSGVADPLTWVTSLLNPRPGAAAPAAVRGPQRATLGQAFFRTWGVDRHVRRTFRPAQDGRGWFPGSLALPTISHWVGGPQDLLLMEPVAPGRRQAAEDVQEVAGRLARFKVVLAATQGAPRTRLVAYLLADGAPEQRAQAQEALGPVADDVIDTNQDARREAFLSWIRELGEQSHPQRTLGG